MLGLTVRVESRGWSLAFLLMLLLPPFCLKLEKEAMKDVITKAVEEERENLEKVHAEEREMWKTEHARDQERVAEAIQAAVQEQQRMSQVSSSPRSLVPVVLSFPGEGTCRDA